MGLYAEPSMDKKEWFKANATPIDKKAVDPAWVNFNASLLPVALLDNGAFCALAVLWSTKEFKRVIGGRPDATLGLIPKSVLRGVVAGGEKLKELKC